LQEVVIFPPDTRAAQLIQLFSNLKRTTSIDVAAAYAVVAWVLGQLVGILMPIFDLPQSIVRVFILLLCIRFPRRALFRLGEPACAREWRGCAGIGPEMDWFLAGALVVVMRWYRISSSHRRPAQRTAQQQAWHPAQ